MTRLRTLRLASVRKIRSRRGRCPLCRAVTWEERLRRLPKGWEEIEPDPAWEDQILTLEGYMLKPPPARLGPADEAFLEGMNP